MKNKVKISLLASMLIASVGLFAQGTNNNYINSIGKKGNKIMLDSVIVSNWKTTKESFELHYTNKFYYDSIGNVIYNFFSILNDDLRKTVYTYNANNKIFLEKEIAKDNWNIWIDDKKTEYSYDTNGNLSNLKQFTFYKTGNRWNFNYAKYFTYDKNNNVISELDSTFNSVIFIISKTTTHYNVIGKIVNTTKAILDKTNWVNYNKTDYIYDSYNKLSFIVDSLYDNNNNNFTKNMYIYDANDDLLAKYNYSWNYSTMLWDITSKTVFTINNSVLLSDVVWAIGPNSDYNTFIHQPTTACFQDYVDFTFINSTLETLYYSPFKASTSTNELTATKIIIYPNPTTGIINISNNEAVENMNITDINGKLIHHQTNNSPIDLSQHAKGIYFINITTEKGVVNKKIVLN